MRALFLLVLAGCSDGTSTGDSGPGCEKCLNDSGAPDAADSAPGDGGNDAASDSGNMGDAGPKTYSTNFLGVENPISENGVWTNGGTVGLVWQNVEKQNGFAYGSGTSAGYDDCIAHLSGFPANHFAQATLHVAGNYTPPSSHEIELLLRFKITANSARGYEINCGWGGAYSQIVRWNGALNDFTYLSPTGPGFGALAEGDVIKATAIGSTITVYKNGNQVMQVTDATWTDGNPGMGMFIRPGGTPKNYCYTQFSAGSL
jgi:hypothetical protein